MTEINYKIISFYSYKGGAGRTTCAANFIYHYAVENGISESNPIVIIDMDVDSAGMTSFLGQSEKTNSSKWNIIDMIIGNVDIKYIKNIDTFLNLDVDEPLSQTLLSFFDMFIKKKFKKLKETDVKKTIDNIKTIRIRTSLNEFFEDMEEQNKNLFFESLFERIKIEKDLERIPEFLDTLLPASGLIDVSYYFNQPPQNILFLGAKQISQEVINYDKGANVIKDIVRVLERHYKKGFTIIIDSSSGRQPSSLIAIESSHIIVFCTRVTNQFSSGTDQQLNTLIPAINKYSKKIFLLPVAVPAYYTKENPLYGRREIAQEAIKFIREKHNLKIAEKKNKIEFIDKEPDNDFFSANCINEVESFKWNEKIIMKKDINNNAVQDEKNAFDAFKKLAKRILEIN